MTHSKKSFTLIEVVVALAILGLGIVAALSLLTSARSRSVKAYDRWKEMHMMSQAIEYFMLIQTENGHVPEQFFPYNDFSASYTLNDPTGLPDDAETTVGSWKLTTMKVELRKNDGSINRTMSMDRIIADESSTASTE